MIVYGLASLTTSFYVVSAVGLACVAIAFNRAGAREEEQHHHTRTWLVMRESALLGAVMLALLIFYDGRSVLPF
jgi:hypothetical protein